MAAADDSLTSQGVRPAVLEENGLRFDADGHETWAPVATVMSALAVLNLAQNPWSTTLTWIFQGAVILMNVLIVHSNLTAVKSAEAAFRRRASPSSPASTSPPSSGPPRAPSPSWVQLLQKARHAIVFGASALALTAVTLAG